MITTWRKELAAAMRSPDEIHESRQERSGDPGPIIHVAPNDAVLDVEFDSGFGSSEGPHFTAWTATRVYFPVVYDGAEAVASVPRDPCDEAAAHVGGE